MQLFDMGESNWIFQILFLLVFMIYAFYAQKIQFWIWLNQIKSAVLQLKEMDIKGKKIAVKLVKEVGQPDFDPSSYIDKLREFFVIDPVDRDPAGVLRRLEHLLDIAKEQQTFDVSKIAPKADSEMRENIENTIQASMAIHEIFRIVRHYYLQGKRTNNIFFIVQIQMQLPLIMKLAQAYYQALKAFSDGVPIGDGIGPLVVSRLEFKHKSQKIVPIKTTARGIYSSMFKVKDRNVIIVRASGPGGRVGKPGEAVRQIVDKYRDKIKRIITVDAGSKLEGEKTGEIVQGIGAAIGDPGPEKYKIEQVATEYNIPLDAIVIKESIDEAITQMRKEIADASIKAVELLESIIEERVKPGEYILIAGIGNTAGIGIVEEDETHEVS